MKDKTVCPNIITDIFLFFLKQKPGPLWLLEGSAEGARPQRGKWDCCSLFIEELLVPTLRYCRLYPLGGRSKAWPATAPGARTWASALPPRSASPIPQESFFPLSSPLLPRDLPAHHVLLNLLLPVPLPAHPETSSSSALAGCPCTPLGFRRLLGGGNCHWQEGGLSRHSGEMEKASHSRSAQAHWG